MFAFDTFTITPALAVTVGSRLARYDYLDGPGLMSPRLEVAVTPADHLRVSALLSGRAQAPGAEEFLPPSDAGVWLPPQRLFSTLDPDGQLRAEPTTHAAIQVERDVAGLTFAVRAFRQHADDQPATPPRACQPSRPRAAHFAANAGTQHRLRGSTRRALDLAAGIHRVLDDRRAARDDWQHALSDDRRALNDQREA